MEIKIREGDWLDGKSLKDCYLNDEGALILGITRDDNSYVGVPNKDTDIYAGDTIIIYGRSEQLKELDERRDDLKGDQSHDRAVNQQKLHMVEQDRQESEHKRKRQLHNLKFNKS
jgi:uncharacterized protein with PhoU and TrkA domain